MKSARTAFIACLIFLSVMEIACAAGGGLPKTTDYWMGVYFGTVKVGYTHTTYAIDKLDNQDVLRRKFFISVRGIREGQKISAIMTHTRYCTLQMVPLMDTLTGVDNNQKISITNEYVVNTIEAKLKMNDQEKEQTLNLNDESRKLLQAGAEYDFMQTNLKPDSKISLWHYFLSGINTIGDPILVVGSPKSSLEVLRKENVDSGGKSIHTWVTQETFTNSKNDPVQVISWQTDDGDILREEYPYCGMVIIRETREKATEREQSPPPDWDTLPV